MGTVCGYIGVTENDRAYRLSTSGDEPEHDYPNFNCHGGVTWCGTLEKIGDYDAPPNMKFIGFDCAHLHDYNPSESYTSKLIGMPMSHIGDIYRNMAYVEEEVRELAKQIYEYNR